MIINIKKYVNYECSFYYNGALCNGDSDTNMNIKIEGDGRERRGRARDAAGSEATCSEEVRMGCEPYASSETNSQTESDLNPTTNGKLPGECSGSDGPDGSRTAGGQQFGTVVEMRGQPGQSGGGSGAQRFSWTAWRREWHTSGQWGELYRQ